MLHPENLYEYQHRAASFILDNPNCALWVDMGLGKTVAALTAFNTLWRDFTAYRCLVIAPLRVAARVWTGEIARWSHLRELSIAPAVGTLSRRLDALKSGATITTLGRENVAWLESLYLEKSKSGKWKQRRPWPWDMVILDESQSFKSQSSYRFKALRRLRRYVPRLVELTGTPAPNGYDDLWSQLYLLDKGERLFTSQEAFRDEWMKPSGYEAHSFKVRNKQCASEIQAKVRDIVLAMKASDYLTLPPVTYNKIFVQLSPKERAKYNEMKKEFIAEMPTGTLLTAANAAVCQGKLLQMANGAIYTNSDMDWEVFHDHKLKALEEILEGLPRPLMLAYNYQSDRSRLSSLLTKLGEKWALLKRDAAFDEFRTQRLTVGLLHPASAGHGLNDLHLSGCETIVWFGLGPNLEYYRQLNARLIGGHRAIGKHVTIHHILTEDTEDSRMLELLLDKSTTEDDLTRCVADYHRSL